MYSSASLRVGILTNQLNNNDGVTKHILDLVKGFGIKYPSVKFIICCTGGDSIDVFTDLGIEVITLANFGHGSRSFFHFISSCHNVYCIAKKYHLDILHSHNHYHANMAAAVHKFCPIRTVQTNHGILPEGGLLKHLNADKLIAINQRVADYFQNEMQFPSEKFALIRGGFAENSTPLEKTASPIKFISAGRFVKAKGFDVYIRAAVKVKRNATQALSFMLAGDGPENEALRNLNAELGNPVHFLGNVRDLPGVLQGTHVLVHPSFDECFPRTFGEAAFAGNLIIAARYPGIELDFDENADGFVVPVNDVDGLIAGIEKYLSNPAEAERRRLHFMEKAGRLLSLDASVEKTYTLYKELLR